MPCRNYALKRGKFKGREAEKGTAKSSVMKRKRAADADEQIQDFNKPSDEPSQHATKGATAPTAQPKKKTGPSPAGRAQKRLPKEIKGEEPGKVSAKSGAKGVKRTSQHPCPVVKPKRQPSKAPQKRPTTTTGKEKGGQTPAKSAVQQKGIAQLSKIEVTDSGREDPKLKGVPVRRAKT